MLGIHSNTYLLDHLLVITLVYQHSYIFYERRRVRGNSEPFVGISFLRSTYLPKHKEEVHMIANYEVVKETYFGRFLGCSLGQVIKSRLLREEPTEIDMTNIDIQIKVDGVEMDLHRLFSVFEKSLTDSPLGQPQPRVVNASEDIISELRELADELDRIQDRVGDECSDAIGAASSSYYCGEYAADSANEAGHEHHPGNSFLSDEISTINRIVESLEEAQRQEEAA